MRMSEHLGGGRMSKSDYRSDIDGLRAIAVLSVLLYHYGAKFVPGGFVGVDVFFVISGYLITKNLSEQISTSGLSIVDFYNRRVRRIFPAALVMLSVSMAVAYFFIPPGDYAEMGKSAAYSAVGAGNFYFFWHTGYFDREAELLPLLHMWSLGVEEQFYLVWPALLAFAMWVSRGRTAVTVSLILAIICISFYGAVHLVAANPKAAFFLPHARAWELALGALLVFVPAVKSRLASEAIGASGLMLIVYSVSTLASTEPFPGWNAVMPVFGSALLVWPRAQTWTARALSVGPMRLTGRLSYSLYLWHWPLLVFFRYYANGDEPGALEASSLAVGAYVLAYLSWHYVEEPVRRVKNKPLKVIGAGLSTMAIVVGVGMFVFRIGGFENRLPPQAHGMRSLEAMWEWDCPQQVEIKELAGSLNATFCVFGAPWEKASVKAILWGDSHAEHMAPLLATIAADHDTSILLYRRCPVIMGKLILAKYPPVPNYSEECAESRAVGVSYLKKHEEIKLVIAAASWSNWIKFLHVSGSEPANDTELLRVGLKEFVEDISSPSAARSIHCRRASMGDGPYAVCAR